MAVETELGVLKSVVNKLDSSLEKISEVSNSIGKLLAVHDERIDQLERSSEKKNDDIREIHSRITTQTREIVEKISALEKSIEEKMKENSNNSQTKHKEIQKELKDDIDNLTDRIGVIERWRWYILGAAASIGYLVGDASDIIKLLK